MRSLLCLMSICLLSVPVVGVHAQEVHNDYQGTWKGRVADVLEEETRAIPGTGTESVYQKLYVEIVDGPHDGEFVTIDSDTFTLRAGDQFYFNYYQYADGSDAYGIVHIDRQGALWTLLGLFILAVVVFGGWQGVRSLVALGGSFAILLFVLMPGLLNGWNPLLASFLVAGGILFAAIFFTHGFNRESAVAYGGTMLSVVLTGVFAFFAVHATKLTGFAAEEAVYLNFNTGGSLDFVGLLLGAIIIGVLGVLDDIAVTQAAVVTELFSSNPDMTRREVYMRALRVGHEHVGALVNTLVLAYTGASLPLLLYAYMSPTGFGATVNSEIFATEIVRAIVGSVGLILTVPIVTLLAVWYLKGYESPHGHSHSHGHVH